MSNEFKNRVYGCVVVKAINANYNADFSGLPRRLKSDGSFYATDKSFKWLVRNYIKKNYSDEKVLFTKVFDKDFKDTLDLKEAFETVTKTDDLKNLKKKDILPKLLECIDVRLFGAVFSPEGAKKDNKDENKNISIHGPVQINHATDLYKKGRVYTDEILAPFTAIGSMSKATEAHYIHNFSINPKNLSSWQNFKENFESELKNLEQIPENESEKKRKEREKQIEDIKRIKKEFEKIYLSIDDINILKNAFNNSATFYDSHSKAGIENEFSLYVTLTENSILTLPNFSQFITFEKDKESNNSFNLTKLIDYLGKYESEIKEIELFYIEELLEVKNSSDKLKDKIKEYDLLEILPKKEKKDETAS